MPSERVIWGPPGTGKTTSGVTLTRQWMARGTSSSQIAYLGFTKAAAKAVAMKLFQTEDDARMAQEFPYFRTIHSLCYRGLRENRQDLRLITTGDMKQFQAVYGMPGAYSVYDWEDLAEVFAKMEDRGRSEWDQALSAYTFSRMQAKSLADLDAARIQPTAEGAMMLGLESMSLDVYQTFVEKYEHFKKSDGLIDFTDMLEYGAREMPPFDDIKYAVIDESQDLCPLHYLILDRILCLSEEIWWVGDDDQCQPAGTRVLVAKDGATKDISELKAGDPVVSFDRRGGYLVGGKHVTRVSSRPYTGDLFTIATRDLSTETTANHRFIGRLIRSVGTCVTYLMERDGRWRVGWCQAFNVEKAFHLGIRANNEKAPRVWILKVHESRTDASIYESFVACVYGIPTFPFEPVNGANHLTRKAVDQFFGMVGDRSAQAEACLKAHGRDIRYPLIDRTLGRVRHRTTLIETEACNLIPELMLLPVPSKANPMKVKWETFSVKRRPVEGLQVYSLDVEKNHTYVADGIVTHNSIFSFSGASAELFLERAKRATYQIQLRQTHRFGQNIVDFSNRIIQRVTNRHPKEIIGVEGREGKIEVTGSFEPIMGEAGEGDSDLPRVMVVHRHVAGCQNVAQRYIDAGLPFRNERGRDPLDAIKRIKAWQAVRDLSAGKSISMTRVEIILDDLLPSVALGEDNRKIRLVVHGSKAKLQDLMKGSATLQDLISLKVLTSDGASVINSKEYHTMRHASDLDYYERVAKNGYDIEDDEAMKVVPRITTIHGAKGREAKQVVVFSEMGDKCWNDPDTEHRLAYVAATRTKSDVTICMENMVHWARSAYDYPTEVPAEAPAESSAESSAEAPAEAPTEEGGDA